jgi:hypothetical protein
MIRRGGGGGGGGGEKLYDQFHVRNEDGCVDTL